MNPIRMTLVIVLSITLTACASVVSSTTQRMASNLSTAMLNQDDPLTVKQGMPAYLILIDSLIEGDPDNTSVRLSAARMYGSYASAFVEDASRARRLAQKSLNHAQKALCLEVDALCAIRSMQLDALKTTVQTVEAESLSVIYGFATAWAGWIQAHSGDWNAIAEIPRLNELLQYCLQLDENFDHGGAHLYLGVLNSQLPPAVGGKPDIGKQHFEKAIAISQGKNLMAKVLFAEHYARLVFDQALHDKLLHEVIDDNGEHEGLILINTLAKQRAATLLQQSADFF